MKKIPYGFFDFEKIKYRDDDALKKMLGNTEIIRLILLFSGVELKYKENK